MMNRSNARKMLLDFLADAFKPGEFRTFLRVREYEAVVSAVNENAGPTTFFDDVIEHMEKRNLIDGTFFDYLEAERENRIGEITRIRKTWLASEKPVEPAATSAQPSDRPRHRSIPWIYAGAAFVLIIGMSSVLYLYGIVPWHGRAAGGALEPAEAFRGDKIRLPDTESSTTRRIVPYRLIVDWLSDSATTSDPQRKGQSQATHMLFLVSSGPYRYDVGKVLLKVSVTPMPAKTATDWIKISVLPVVRRDGFVRIEGLDQRSGRPSLASSGLQTEKKVELDGLRKGDSIELVVLVKASSAAFYERIAHLPYEQLFSVK